MSVGRSGPLRPFDWSHGCADGRVSSQPHVCQDAPGVRKLWLLQRDCHHCGNDADSEYICCAAQSEESCCKWKKKKGFQKERVVLDIWQKCSVSITISTFLLSHPCRPESTGNLQWLRETTSPCWMCMKHSLRYSVCICTVCSSAGDSWHNTELSKKQGRSWPTSRLWNILLFPAAPEELPVVSGTLPQLQGSAAGCDCTRATPASHEQV